MIQLTAISSKRKSWLMLVIFFSTDGAECLLMFSALSTASSKHTVTQGIQWPEWFGSVRFQLQLRLLARFALHRNRATWNTPKAKKRASEKESQRKRERQRVQVLRSDASPRIGTDAVAISQVASTAAGIRDVALLLFLLIIFLSQPPPLLVRGKHSLSRWYRCNIPITSMRRHATSSTGSRATTDLDRLVESPATTCVPLHSPNHCHLQEVPSLDYQVGRPITRKATTVFHLSRRWTRRSYLYTSLYKPAYAPG